MNAKIYLEGGGESKDLGIRCREGFRKLLEKCGFGGRMPRLVRSGSREKVFEDFKTALRSAGAGDYVAMLIDSEDRMTDIEQPWPHLKTRDDWEQPADTVDEQVLLMVTCMETWIATDRAALQSYYGSDFQEPALPPLTDMESRNRHAIQDAIKHATRKCGNAYRKDKRSFKILGKLDPDILGQHLPSFVRMRRILREKL